MTPESGNTGTGDAGGTTVTDPSKSEGDSSESTILGDSEPDTGTTRTARK